MGIDRPLIDRHVTDLTEETRALQLSKRRVMATILVVCAALVTVNVALGLLQLLGAKDATAALSTFDLDAERNAATWFASALLLTAAALLGVIGATSAPSESRRPWLGLAGLFVLMSLDETAAWHERLIQPLRSAFGTAGSVFHFAWVIPGIALVVLVAALYMPFLRRLPRVTRTGFVLAGATYVSGAIGLEMLMGVLLEPAGQGVVTGVTVLAEETLELLGVTLLIATLLGHLQHHRPTLSLVLEN